MKLWGYLWSLRQGIYGYSCALLSKGFVYGNNHALLGMGFMCIFRFALLGSGFMGIVVLS